MSNQNVSITLANSSSLDDPYWLNMEIKEDPLEDGMTVAAAADLIDAAYNITACEQQSSNDIWQQGADTNRDIWIDVSDGTGIDAGTVAAQKRFVDALDVGSYTDDCEYDADSIQELVSYELTIKIFRSHQDELYKLQMANGKASAASIHQGRVVKTLNVENQTSVTLDNPIIHHRPVQAPVVSWQGAHGGEIHIKGNTLYWDEPFTGTIRAEFDTEWDEVTITVTGDPADSEMISGTDQSWYGTGWYSGSESGDEIDDYQNVQCSVLAFYHFQYEELILNRPEEDESTTDIEKVNICHFVMTTVDAGSGDSGGAVDEDGNPIMCQQHVYETIVCQCEGKETTDSHYEPVQCPVGVRAGATLQGSVERRTYKDCGYRDEVNTEAFYEEKCCELPEDAEITLPQCQEVVTRFTGEGEQVNKDDYPEGTNFVTVSPVDGQCGEHTVQQVLNAAQCCDGVSELVWVDEESVDVLEPDSQGYVLVTEGRMPRTVKIRGKGFWLDRAHTKQDAFVNGELFRVYTDDEACGTAIVTVTDGCSSVEGTIKSTVGTWSGDCYIYEVADYGGGASTTDIDSFEVTETCFYTRFGASGPYETGTCHRWANWRAWKWNGSSWINTATDSAGLKYLITSERSGLSGGDDLVAAIAAAKLPYDSNPNALFPNGPGDSGCNCGDPSWVC